MGATKELYMIEVEKAYYEEHYPIFKPCKVKSVRVKGEDHKDDPNHKKLLSKYMIAKKELSNYEYDKRHNYNK